MTEAPRIDVIQNGDDVTVACSGALDLYSADRFGDALKPASRAAEQVVVDMVQVSFIDTAIIQNLLIAARTMMRRGKRLRVMVAENGYPLRVLGIIGCPDFMDIEAQAE